MSNNAEEEYLIGPIIRNDKNFVYKNKKYPISFDSVKNNSDYFYSNSDSFKEENIELQLEIEISEDTIKSFINCCHNQKFKINETNVFHLDYLSRKYKVPKLTKITQEYISRPNTNLAFQSLLFKYQQQKTNKISEDEKQVIDTTKEEEIISERLKEYLNEEQLIELPIPIIDRILKKSLKVKKDDEYLKEIIEFLFKCLDKHKRKASVLFLNINMDNQPKDLITRLLNDYGEIFDFNMISLKSILNTSSELLKELIIVKKEYSEKIVEMNEIIISQKEEIKQFNEIRNFVDTELKTLIQNQKNIIETQRKEIDTIKENLNSELKSIKEKQNQVNETQIREINKIKEDLKSELKDFVQNKINEEHQIIMKQLNCKASTEQVQKEILNRTKGLIMKEIPIVKYYEVLRIIFFCSFILVFE